MSTTALRDTCVRHSQVGYFAPMRFAVAVVLPPDHHDISGGAFHEVAEALHHGLLALGHDSVLTNRLDIDDRRTIVLGSNLLVQYALDPPKTPSSTTSSSWAMTCRG